jgi:hypothetical protein
MSYIPDILLRLQVCDQCGKANSLSKDLQILRYNRCVFRHYMTASDYILCSDNCKKNFISWYFDHDPSCVPNLIVRKCTRLNNLDCCYERNLKKYCCQCGAVDDLTLYPQSLVTGFSFVYNDIDRNKYPCLYFCNTICVRNFNSYCNGEYNSVKPFIFICRPDLYKDNYP